jgi:hypothetical protein
LGQSLILDAHALMADHPCIARNRCSIICAASTLGENSS